MYLLIIYLFALLLALCTNVLDVFRMRYVVKFASVSVMLVSVIKELENCIISLQEPGHHQLQHRDITLAHVVPLAAALRRLSRKRHTLAALTVQT
jgi:hypothetical protein